MLGKPSGEAALAADLVMAFRREGGPLTIELTTEVTAMLRSSKSVSIAYLGIQPVQAKIGLHAQLQGI